ncbi:hypothetical protein L2E82_01874 [Cichorium intybus]|uniref:Uncharacterized protein n=1 Tax=Cichorium intybus TaxID=13427 RepID=A0ACB9H293_CICIN|nr:hypothetical protein L2E82_01874 [Cichorium intybus]
MNLFNSFNIALLFDVFLVLVSLEVIESGFLVKTLPGFPGDLPFTLETGYIGVGEPDDVQLFYYFIESEGNPRNDPLMLWLSGGPGCSSLSGILYEIGPFTINYANSTLEKPMLKINHQSWTKVANIIFLDQPAGSGFSYAKTPKGYITNDTLSSKHAHYFLRKWLVEHPKFLNNPFYVGGDSYMGIVVPMIVHEIYNGTCPSAVLYCLIKELYVDRIEALGATPDPQSQTSPLKGNEVGEGPQINIKGYVLGNPRTDSTDDYNSKIPFAHRVALLSDAIYKSTKENCHGDYLNINPNNVLCINDLQVVQKCIGRLYPSQFLEPICDDSDPLKSDLLWRVLKSLDNAAMDIWSLPQVGIRWCRDDNYIYSYVWANRRDVRDALHIHKITRNLMESSGCRALVYSGDHDMLVPYSGTLNWIKSLKFLVVNDWRPWFVDKQVAGYTIKYSNQEYNLTFATLKGGGHTAPEYKPKECLSMFTRWLANDAL